MLFVWFIVFLIYILHDKVELCLAAFCAKCRGDDEFEYDSEDDSDEQAMGDDCVKCKETEHKK